MRPFDNAANMALGGAGIAFPAPDNGVVNDALLGRSAKTGVYLSSAIPYGIGGWQAHHFQGVLPVGTKSGFALDIEHSAIEAYGEQRFQLQYGRRLGEKILLGGAIQFLRVSAQEYGSATNLGFAVSLLAEPFPDFWLGARVQNPAQPKFGDDAAPGLLRIGACWKASEAMYLMAETEKDLDRPAQAKAGLEYRIFSALRLRAGFRTKPNRLCFGAGWRLKNGLALDVGSEWHPTLGFTPAAMVSWQKP